MSLNSLFKSKEEKAQDSKEYLDKLFPFGLEQRDMLMEVTNILFPDHKKTNLFFNYIVAKQNYLDEKLTDDKREKNVTKFIKRIRPRLDQEKQEQILQVIIYDCQLESLIRPLDFIAKYNQ